MNKVLVSGRLVRDPEVRYTQGGMAIATFTVATTRKYKKGDEWVDETAFIDTKCFGASAENLAKFFKSGSGITFEGRLVTESWEDKQTGQKRSKLVVMLEQWEFPPSSKKSEEGEAPRKPAPAPAPASKPKADGEEDDDVPF